MSERTEPLKWRGEMSDEEKAFVAEVIRDGDISERESKLLELLRVELHRVKCLESDLHGMDIMYNNLERQHTAYRDVVSQRAGRLRYVESLLSREMKFERNPDSRIGRAYRTVQELLGY